MTTLAPTTQLPEPLAFDDDAAPFRPVAPPLSSREEMRLEILANDIVNYAPRLARRLRHHGLARLRGELQEA